MISNIVIFYNVGAVLGAVVFGQLSEMYGRKRSMLAALALSLTVIPSWAFGNRLATLLIGSFLMQVGVQGAWGIVPAHLNELSPDAARGLLAGFAYQLGVLFGAPVNSVEFWLRNKLGYAWALAGFEMVNIVLLAITISLGSEKKGKSFLGPGAAPG
jgi:SHS family lactate transporter-like MFS transporter